MLAEGLVLLARTAPGQGVGGGIEGRVDRGEGGVEVALDVAEAADIIMVKPAGTSLDIISDVAASVDLPVAAYQVSGEYAMLKAATLNGWLDEEAVVLEAMSCMKRAGADGILTYYAVQVAEWLKART